MRAFSTRFVKVVSSTIACALACLTKEGLINRVILCFSSFDILEILHLVKEHVKLQLVQLVQFIFAINKYSVKISSQLNSSYQEYGESNWLYEPSATIIIKMRRC